MDRWSMHPPTPEFFRRGWFASGPTGFAGMVTGRNDFGVRRPLPAGGAPTGNRSVLQMSWSATDAAPNKPWLLARHWTDVPGRLVAWAAGWRVHRRFTARHAAA